MYGTDEMGTLITAAELFLSNVVTVPLFAVQATNTHTLLECLIIARRNRDIVSGYTLLQRVCFATFCKVITTSSMISFSFTGISRHAKLLLCEYVRNLQEMKISL